MAAAVGSTRAGLSGAVEDLGAIVGLPPVQTCQAAAGTTHINIATVMMTKSRQKARDAGRLF